VQQQAVEERAAVGQLEESLALQEAKLCDIWHQIQANGVVAISLQVLPVIVPKKVPFL
jgi:hypothetical protein